MATGKIVALSDHGTLVQVFIRQGDETTVAAGDGNLTRRALYNAFNGEYPVGKYIEYEMEAWGGLKWFRPLDDDDDEAAEAAARGG